MYTTGVLPVCLENASFSTDIQQSIIWPSGIINMTMVNTTIQYHEESKSRSFALACAKMENAVKLLPQKRVTKQNSENNQGTKNRLVYKRGKKPHCCGVQQQSRQPQSHSYGGCQLRASRAVWKHQSWRINPVGQTSRPWDIGWSGKAEALHPNPSKVQLPF